MGNSNLKTFDNLYSSLAESAYNGRPNSFSMKELTETQKKLLESGKSIPFDFSKNAKSGGQITAGGGKNLPHGGKVYLQPDPDLHLEVENRTLPGPSEAQDITINENRYYKGLMTDEKAGFNSYFLTDTPTLGKDTTKTYMAIRGSDGFNIDKISEYGIEGLNLNDWVDNDAHFALNHAHIPQAKLATVAMKERIKEIKTKASAAATMDVTAHSLGTMVSVQGLAGLSSSELDTIGNVVLFDGPDTRKSLKKMGVSKEVYDKLDQKITYYVNPFDIVSMLNRENTIYNLENPDQKPKEQGLGTVHVMVPLNYTAFHNMNDSAHDFGVMQMSASGEFLVASKDYHPELLKAGEKIARLEQKYLNVLRAQGFTDDEAFRLMHSIILAGVPGLGLAEAGGLAGATLGFFDEYMDIIKEARKESIAWDRKAIEDYQRQLSNGISDSSKRIDIQTKLVQTAAQLANFEAEDSVNSVVSLLDTAKEKVQKEVDDGINTAYSMAAYLSRSEVDQLLADFSFEKFWKEGIYDATVKEAKSFKTSIDQMSATLNRAVASFQEADSLGADGFKQLLEDTKSAWR